MVTNPKFQIIDLFQFYPFFNIFFEKAMFDRLLKYLDKYNMLSTSQFGFRPNHSITIMIFKY